MPESYTDTLLGRYSTEFKLATQHPFLQQAGEGTLDRVVLEKWCRQDYLYAFVGYIKFASLLLSRLPLPSCPPNSTSRSRARALYSAIPLLSYSISNIARETEFFVSTAKEHGLDLRSGPDGEMPVIDPTNGLGEYEEVTRGYVDFLWGIGAGGSLEEGLVLLWGMEKAYYEAWTYAKSHLSSRPQDESEETETQKALGKFIDNWTNKEFVSFVEHCKEVVDGLEIEKGDTEVSKRCEQVFQRVLYLERRFWPDVE